MGTKISIEGEKLEQYNGCLKKLKLAILISTAIWLLPYFILRGIAFLYMLVTDTDIAQDNLLFPTDPISQPAGYFSYTIFLIVVLITAYFVIKGLKYRNKDGKPRYWLITIQVIAGIILLLCSYFISIIVLMIQGLLASYIFPYSFQ